MVVVPAPDMAKAHTASLVARLRILFAVLLLAVPGAVLIAGAHRLAAAGIVVLAVALVWALTERLIARPVDRIARDLRLLATEPAMASRACATGWAAGLAEAAALIRARLTAADASRAQDLAAATTRIDEQKRRLEAILLDLSEGVIVCGADDRVLLFNQAAADLVGPAHGLGLGRVVFEVLARDDVLERRDRLARRTESTGHTEQFVCATIDADRLLHVRLALLAPATAGAPPGYVLTLAPTSVPAGARMGADTAPGEVTRRPRPPRPEFYDFDLAHQPAVTQTLRERDLRALSYVVFDVETTGLNLTAGDEVVSIGAVRVVNLRVRPMETFDRLVNPGRPIPQASVRFHGVTDVMVRDKPLFASVLPQFKRFVGDSVLVAHNAAFDMSALTRGGRGCGLSFDNPVLDTLLISAWLDPDETAHDLDAIARRQGIEVTARHDALGDAMVTAAILVSQLERARMRGIERFGQLAVATDMSARLRQHQRQFETDPATAERPPGGAVAASA